MFTAVIVDDHPFIRASVQALLSLDKIQVVGEAENGRDAVMLVRETVPSVAIIDISLPLLDGLSVITRIKATGLPVRVVVLSSQPAEFYSLRCMRAGANAYVSKNDQLGELRKAVHAVMAGYSFFPEVALSSVNRCDAQDSERERLAQLSNREIMVFHLLARGFANKDIAEHLGLSAKTVSSYKFRLMHKMRASSIVELAEIARRHALY